MQHTRTRQLAAYVRFSVAAVFVIAGTFGCVDPVATRRIELIETRGVGSGTWGPFKIDISQLPPDAVSGFSEKTDGLDNWTTHLRVFANRPIKIMIVPATQP